MAAGKQNMQSFFEKFYSSWAQAYGGWKMASNKMEKITEMCFRALSGFM